MKKILVVGMSLLTLNLSAFEITTDAAIKYSVPCVLAYGAEALVGAPAGTGSVACLTSIAVNYFNDDEQKNIQFRKEVRDSQLKLTQQVQKNNEKHLSDLATFRDTLRRIIAEKIIEINTRAEEVTIKSLESKEFKDKIYSEIKQAAVKKSGETSVTLDKWMSKNKERILKQVEAELTKRILKRGLKSSQSVDGLDQYDSETKQLEEKMKKEEEKTGELE